MPQLGAYHPIVVHFTIALLVAGALFRWLSLTGRAAFSHPTAAILLLVGTLTAVVAVRSGDDAHGPVERIPGAVGAVVEHEEWGVRTRNVFLFVAAAELVGLWLARRGRAKPALFASGVLCLAGVFCLYEAAEHGGELVYSYAGGVGTRTGDPADVGRLLIAAAHNQAAADRKAGRPDDAASVIAEAARRFPGDAAVQLMYAESLLVDRKDAAAAVAVLGRVSVPADDRRLRLRHGFLTADALEAVGKPDEARAALQTLQTAYPDNARVRQRLAASPSPR